MAKALVVFTGDLPTGTYDLIIAPRARASEVHQRGVAFEALEDLIDPGSVEDASHMAQSISRTTLPSGERMVKSALYKGYELWWIHYDELYYKYCLPFTQYERLLKRLTEYTQVEMYAPPSSTLFAYYLAAHEVAYTSKEDPSAYLFTPTHVVQTVLSFLFIPWLLLRGPQAMLTTSDLFDPPRDHDFRLRYIYEELYKRDIPFVECVRSGERLSTMLSHAWTRRRPVLYTHALTQGMRALARVLGKQKPVVSPTDRAPREKFYFALAAHYAALAPGDRLAIGLLTRIYRLLGIKAGIVNGVNSRNFCETLASKLAGAPVVGVLHGAAAQSYVVFDFMPEYDGEKALGADRYGVWSEWWREYYVHNSKVYTPEQLFVSGPMRPVVGEEAPPVHGETYKVLFASEQLAAMQEVMPYLDALLARNDIEIYFKFRSYRDRFKEWIVAHRPDILEKIPSENMLTCTMGEAAAACDVVVGSHSTGVLESLLYLRPFIFYKTKKWGDYFDLKTRLPHHALYAESPAALIEGIHKSRQVPQEALRMLCQQFFGDPRQNGSAWVIDQVEGLVGRR